MTSPHTRRANSTPPLVIAMGFWFLAVALTCVLIAWLQRNQNVAFETRFDAEVGRVMDDIQRRFSLPVSGLMGARGVYAASESVNRDEFRRYVESRRITEEFPGIRGIGFIERVQRDDVEAFVARERLDGFPAFDIQSSGDFVGDDLYVIKFIEPMAQNLAAVGLDIGSSEARRTGAVNAARSGRPALSRPIRLVQDAHSRPGFLLFVPVYRPGVAAETAEERLNALQGLTYSPIVLEELLAPSLQSMNASQLNIRILSTAGATPEPLYETGDQAENPRLMREVPLGVLQSELTIQLRSTPALESMANRQWVYGTGLLGLALSTLMAWVLWLLLSGRARAESRAAELTADLQKLALVAERTANSVLMTDANLRITWVNEGFTRMTGYSLQEVLGRTPGELLSSGKADPEVLETLRRSTARGEHCRVEILNRAKDGRAYWVDTEVQPIRDDMGVLEGFIEIGLDVTQERQTHEELKLAVQKSLDQQEKLDFLARVARSTSNAVILFNPDGLIQWVNDGFTRITGYTLDEALGRRPKDFLQCAETDPAAIETFAQAMLHIQPCRFEILNQGKSGQQYWLEVELQPLIDTEGRHTGFMSIESDITERRRATEDLRLTQQQLESQRKRLDNILRGTNVGTWQWHIPSGQTVFNERWAEIVGYTLAELEPVSIDTWMRFAHPDDLALSSELLQRHFSRELDYYESEARMRHRDGHWVWVLDRGQVADWNDDGSPGWMYGTHQDISQRKYTEIALRTSERRQRTLSTLSAQWFWETDAEHRFIHFECGDPQQLHHLNTQGLGKRRWETTADPVSTSWSLHRQAIERREPFRDLVYRRTEQNGRVVYWSVSGAPWFDEDGTFVGYVGIGSDVTKAKEAELRIARSEALLERTGKLAKVGAWRVDLKTGQPEWSAQTCRIHDVPVGYAPSMDEALNFYAPEARPVITSLVEKGMQTGEGWDVELPLVTATGRHIWVRAIGEVEMIDGKPVALIGGFQDITDQRARADELREAKQSAEQASQFKSQFLANMSHEIRTPMNAILGMLKLLHTTPLQPRQLDYVEKTEGAARSLLGLLNDILDFSKVEAGKMTLDPQPFQLDALMRDLSVIFSASVGNKPVEVLFDIDPAVPRRLVGDALRLQQILINLGGNAIKFTPQGEVVLRIQLVGETDDHAGLRQAHIQFEVQDSGIGIATENQHKIFAGFTQAEASTTRRFGGTGLGLSITRRLIELMGGTLALNSEIGRGTTFGFRVALPIADAPTECLPDTSAAPPSAPWCRRGMAVLVVDDNPIARELMVRMGDTLGWAVEAVGDGHTALATIEEKQRLGTPFEVLFLDWQMTDIDGWSIASQVKALYQGSHPAPVIIMVTAHGPEMLASQTPEVQSLIDGYLVKPVTASMLFDALQSAHTPGHLSASRTQTAVRRPLAGLKILVVEDNAINQQVAEELLIGQGASVYLADNGLRGVEAIEAAHAINKPYDAVLMDMQMPVMDGLEATREIRERLKLHTLPIIAMTANALASDRDECLRAGMNDHVGKPFDLDRLTAMILNWTRGGMREEKPIDATHATPAGKTVSTVLNDVPVLDTESALSRVGGSESLLRRMRTQFLSDLPNLMATCKVGVQNADLKAVQQTLHTIKGVAATLGAERLSQAARLQEEACKREEVPDVASLGVVVEQTEQAFLDSGASAPLRVENGSEGSPPSPVTVTEAQVELLRRLQQLLRESDMGVFDLKDQLVAMSPQDLHQWAHLDAAVESMDFGKAILLIEAALRKD